MSRVIRNRAVDADDYVRIEIECAFRQQLPVIPLLIGHATKPPREADLPASIKQFAFCHSVTLDPGRDFDVHVTRLVGDIERFYKLGEVNVPEGKSESGETATKKLKEARWHEERQEFHEAARLYREAALAAVTTEDNPLDYLRGRGIPWPWSSDLTFADEIKTRAENGEPEAQFAWGQYWCFGGLHQSEWGYSFGWYEMAAKQQFVPAMFRLAEECEKGYSENGVVISPGDDKEAAHWYRAAAETLLR